MSRYEDYTEASKTYDEVRKPVGADVEAAFIISSHVGTPLADIRVLEAGCGTGNYSLKFITDHKLTNLTLLDANEGMLARARSKISAVTTADVSYKVATLPDLPFEKDSFHAITFNYVLHHLEAGTDQTFAITKEALANAAKCLKPGGILMVTSVSAQQLRDGFWFFAPSLIPERVYDTLTPKFMPFDMMVDYLGQLAFTDIKVLAVIGEGVLTDKYAENPDGPLDEKFRASLSGFALMTPAEISEMVGKIEEMKRNGTYGRFVADRKNLSQICGDTTLIIAKRQ